MPDSMLVLGGLAALVFLLKKKSNPGPSVKNLLAATEAQSHASAEPTKIQEAQRGQIRDIASILKGKTGIGAIDTYRSVAVTSDAERFAVLWSMDPELAKLKTPDFSKFQALAGMVHSNPYLQAIANEKDPAKILARAIPLLDAIQGYIFSQQLALQARHVLAAAYPSQANLFQELNRFIGGARHGSLPLGVARMFQHIPEEKPMSRAVEHALASLCQLSGFTPPATPQFFGVQIAMWQAGNRAADDLDGAAQLLIKARAHEEALKQLAKAKIRPPGPTPIRDVFRSKQAAEAASAARHRAYREAEEAAVERAMRAGGDDLLSTVVSILRRAH